MCRIAKVQLSDMGAYRCAVITGDDETVSTEGHLQLEGKSQFTVHIVNVCSLNKGKECSSSTNGVA